MRALAGAVLALVLCGAALFAARAWLADVLTTSGAPEWQRPLAGTTTESSAPSVPRAPVRVLLLDGLARADAHGPTLDAFCARGMDLAIDVGFPTKSLPVQSVLWSGLTAQQSGIAMRNELPRPLADTLPAKIAGARAVVEAWPQIARSAGFAHVEGMDVAGDAVASDAPLVLVHVLAIDAAGHRQGRDAAYRAEVARADALLGTLVARAPTATWLVLSDHGHLARGGHGDAEPEVRIVRGCVAPRPPNTPAAGAVHLVDVSRHLHDTLGVTPSPSAVGRPLAVAAAHRDVDATLPRTSMLATVAALVVAALGMAIALRWGRPRPIAFAPLLAVAVYVLACGTPSLSHRDPDIATLLGVIAVAVALIPPGRLHPARVTGILAPACSTVIAAAILGRLPVALLGGPPARLPFSTAWAQILVGTVTPALLVGVTLVAYILSERRTSGKRTETSGGSDQAVRGSDNDRA